MSKAVLISIRPEWCRLIASGKKTIEVRKTKPNAILPLKCYIYQTLPKHGDWNESDGHVIGEFICHNIYRLDIPFPAYWDQVDKKTLDAACLTYAEAHNYLGHRSGYAWRISDLVIYGKPKQLREFYKWFDGANDIRPCQNGNDCKHLYYDYSENCQACGIDFDGTDCPYYKVQKAPQSWMYVEELA